MKQWIAKDPHAGLGTVVGSGHCMAHVQQLHGVPHSSRLRRGERVRDMADPPRGLIIATFGGNPPRYQNRTDGTSHIAVLVSRNTDGLLAIDQWQGKPVGERVIRYRGGNGTPVNDGDAYYAVLSEETA